MRKSGVKPTTIRTSVDPPLDLHGRLQLDPPLVASTGKLIDLTNEQIYEILELP
ncbi:MAG TPA: hypothetical protein VNY05_17285 [Candidatus Acidoferrales bacterium]|nr:hypothetical protein [Candidatus Acidoferrales bacterium]